MTTLRRIHSTLTRALNTAVRRGLIERNPAATVELPPARRPKVTTGTAEDLGRFLEATEGDRLHPLHLLLDLVGCAEERGSRCAGLTTSTKACSRRAVRGQGRRTGGRGAPK